MVSRGIKEQGEWLWQSVLASDCDKASGATCVRRRAKQELPCLFTNANEKERDGRGKQIFGEGS